MTTKTTARLRVRCGLLLMLLLALPAVLVADGMNDSGHRLVGTTAERWSGGGSQNSSDFTITQVGLYYASATRQNADGYVLQPALAFSSGNPRRQDIINWLLGLVPLTPTEQTLLDANDDERLDISDVVDLTGEPTE